jgi:alpha-tubulin suppressor-like RCC1 family protein
MFVLMRRFHKILVCTVVFVGVFGLFALRSGVVASGRPVANRAVINNSRAVAINNPAAVTSTATETRTSTQTVTRTATSNARLVQGSWGNFTTIATGGAHTCALNSTGNAYCWGTNASGHIGNGTTTSSNAPVAVTMPTGVTFTSIGAGFKHTCALTTTGTVYCWGENSSGNLGNGTTTDSNIPVAVTMPAGVTFTTISVNN